MRVIGFRAEKDVIRWAVVDGTSDNPTLIENGKITAPKDYAEATALNLFRTQIQTLIRRQQPKLAALRMSETYLTNKPAPNAFASMLQRARIEGVLLELAVAEGVDIHSQQLAQIKSGLGSADAKAYLKSDDLRGLDWSTIKNAAQREAIMAAAALLE